MREIAGQKRCWKGAVALITAYTLLIGGLGWLMFGVLTLPFPAPTWLTIAHPPAIEEQRRDIADEATSPRNAMQSLFNVWGYDVPANDAWCNQALRADLVCSKGSAKLDELIQQGLPWIAELQTDRGALHAVVIRAENDSLDLLINQDLWTVKRAWFEAHWHQNYTLFWKGGPNGISTINSKSKPEDILWLDSILSKILNLTPSQTAEWKPILVEKVKLFQKQQKLVADGVVGKTTFMHLWKELGNTPTLLTDKSSTQLAIPPKTTAPAQSSPESDKR
ncbi:general secretion pathway protein GspA [Enterobacterales bacterium]|nr:general secretion pathway protein GspA [Enterobacterales bacterium]